MSNEIRGFHLLLRVLMKLQVFPLECCYTCAYFHSEHYVIEEGDIVSHHAYCHFPFEKLFRAKDHFLDLFLNNELLN